MSKTISPDETMDAIMQAVTLGRDGDTERARTVLTEIWESIGPQGDPLHRCTLAHFMADLQPDAAQALAWDVRALDAAASLTNERAQQHHSTLDVAGFYPSLHLNLADNYRQLGSFEAAQREIDSTRACLHTLGDDPYGETIRTVLDEVESAIHARSTVRRESAPGTSPAR
ncbi:hypothetical protein [Nocardia sp. XZ_19_385]|uniref:hypothetical protein n=1 Tax=Nocardia sp. XZ_19_385 TaxID=2769488 RepID=UPI001890247E|nr:hypothetical protein [Nocardia sp. XZ_19_385]